MPAPHVPVELRDLPEPGLAPGSVLLRTLYSEVCGTDDHIWHGRLAGVPYPIIPGHVSIGLADQIRGEVREVDRNQALADAESLRLPKALVKPS